MHFARTNAAVLLSITLSVFGQQAPTSATKDTQAVSVIEQALATAGGAQAIITVSDYTATGNITYHFAEDVRGKLAVRASSLDEIRVDAKLPGGTRSEIISRGEITYKAEDGTIGQPGVQAPIAPARLILPNLLLATALNSDGYKLSYLGLADLEGRSTHHLQLELVLPGTASSEQTGNRHILEFLIDASTFQVLMTQDTVSRHSIRQIRYSDQRLVAGTLVPFSIEERIDGRSTWQMQLDNIAFNSGLQDSDFNP
jgi:hypothetical protein